MAVFSHPDDETVAGPLLARYAAEGHHVRLFTVTSGEAGVTANLPAGVRLGAAREEELRRACACLGIDEPLFGGFPDGGIHSRDVQDRLSRALVDVFGSLRPDIVITWGGDGATGHPDHRVTGAVASQVFQSLGTSRKLYFAAAPASLFSGFSSPDEPLESLVRILGRYPVADKYITTVVDCRAWLDEAGRAIRCHRTQWNNERMRAFDAINRELLGGKVYLRLALADTPIPAPMSETDIMAGL